MIALIPARGGSKGLPRKNIRNLYGKPMIAYTIEAALNSKYIDEVIISTDCKEIEKVALEYGAKCHFSRPDYLATDDAKAIDTYIYTVERLNTEFNYSINDFIVLLPTVPLRSTDDIDGAIKLFNKKKADSVISYTEEYHPIKWHKYISNDGKFENIFEENLLNRQNIRPSYFPNGAIFIFTLHILKIGKYYSDNSYAYIMPRSRSIDVDTLDDFEYIEFLIGKKYDEK